MEGRKIIFQGNIDVYWYFVVIAQNEIQSDRYDLSVQCPSKLFNTINFRDHGISPLPMQNF